MEHHRRLNPGGRRFARTAGVGKASMPLVPLLCENSPPLPVRPREPGLQAKLRTYRRVVEERAVERGLGKAYMAKLTLPAQTAPSQKRRRAIKNAQSRAYQGMYAWGDVEATPAALELQGVAAKTAAPRPPPSVGRATDGIGHGAPRSQLRPKLQQQQRKSSPAAHDVPAPTRLNTGADILLDVHNAVGGRCSSRSSQRSASWECPVANNAGAHQTQQSHGVDARDAPEAALSALGHWSEAVWARFGEYRGVTESSSYVARACVKWLATSCSTHRGSFRSLHDFSESCIDLGIHPSLATEIAARIWAGLASGGSLSVSALLANVADYAPSRTSRSSTATPGQRPRLGKADLPGSHPHDGASNYSGNASSRSSSCGDGVLGDDSSCQSLPTAVSHSRTANDDDAWDLHQDDRLEPPPRLPAMWQQQQQQQQHQQLDVRNDALATCLNEEGISTLATTEDDASYLAAAKARGALSESWATSEDQLQCDRPNQLVQTGALEHCEIVAETQGALSETWAKPEDQLEYDPLSELIQTGASQQHEIIGVLQRLRPGQTLSRPQSELSCVTECRGTEPLSQDPDSPLSAHSLEPDSLYAELGANSLELEGLRMNQVVTDGEQLDGSANEAVCRERAKHFVASIVLQAAASRSIRPTKECDSQKLLGPCCVPVFHDCEAPAPRLGVLDVMHTCSPSPEPPDFVPSRLVADPSPPSTPRKLPLDRILVMPGLDSSGTTVQAVLLGSKTSCNNATSTHQVCKSVPELKKTEFLVQHVQPEGASKAAAPVAASVEVPRAQPVAAAAAAAAATDATAEATPVQTSAATIKGARAAASASSEREVREHVAKSQAQHSPQQSNIDDRWPVTLQEHSPRQSETADVTITKSNPGTGGKLQRRIGSFFSTVTKCMSLKR